MSEIANATESNVVCISDEKEFRRVATAYGVKLPKRGRLPRKALAEALIIAGVLITDTIFFSRAHAFPGAVAPKSVRENRYTIRYRVVTGQGRRMPNVLETEMTDTEIRELTPNVKGRINEALVTIALATRKAGTGVADAQRLYVESVTRVEDSPEVSSSDAETVEDTPGNADTPEASTVVLSESEPAELLSVS